MDLLDGKVIIVVSGRCPKRARLCASIFLLSPKARQKGFSLRSLTHGSPCNESVSHETRHKKHWTIPLILTAWGTEWKSFLPCHPMVPPVMNRFRTEQGIKSTEQSAILTAWGTEWKSFLPCHPERSRRKGKKIGTDGPIRRDTPKKIICYG